MSHKRKRNDTTVDADCSVFVMSPDTSKQHDSDSIENHKRIEYILDGLRDTHIKYHTHDNNVSIYDKENVVLAFKMVHNNASMENLPVTDHKTDCYKTKKTSQAVTSAIFTSCGAAQHCIDHKVPVFSVVRPPGHHARSSKATGFCWRNTTLITGIFCALQYKVIKNIMIFDMDHHHGGGIEDILKSTNFHKQCSQHNIRILYYSVYHQDTFDSESKETASSDVVLFKERARYYTQVIRKYSSTSSTSWSEGKTEAKLQETIEFLNDNAKDFDIMLVAAGFDHCIGEPETILPSQLHVKCMWSLEQVGRLGNAIHNASAKTTVTRPVAVLEGGYNKNTLTTFVPRFMKEMGITTSLE